MVASVLQSATNVTTATSITATLTLPPTVGNTLVVFANSDATLTISDGAGGTWTQHFSFVSDQGFYIWSRTATLSDTTTFTVTPSVSDWASLVVVELAGVGTTPFDVVGTVTNVGTTGSSTSSSITTTQAADIVFSAHALHGYSGSPPSGITWNNSFTTVANAIDGAGASALKTAMLLGSKIQATSGATGATTATWTNNASHAASVQIAFKAAGSTNATVTVPASSSVNFGVTAPSVTTGVNASITVPAAQVVTFSAPIPVIDASRTVNGGATPNITLTVLAPVVTTTSSVSITVPGSQAVSLSAQPPVVSTNGNVTITVPIASGVSFAPPFPLVSVSSNAQVIVPSSQNISILSLVPSVITTSSVNVSVLNSVGINLGSPSPLISGNASVSISVPGVTLSINSPVPIVNTGEIRNITLIIRPAKPRFSITPYDVNLDI